MLAQLRSMRIDSVGESSIQHIVEHKVQPPRRRMVFSAKEFGQHLTQFVASHLDPPKSGYVLGAHVISDRRTVTPNLNGGVKEGGLGYTHQSLPAYGLAGFG